MPSQSPGRQQRHFRAGSAFLVLAIALPLHGQSSPAPAVPSWEALQQRAQTLADSQKPVEAEQGFRQAVKDYESHAAEHAGDVAYLLHWFHCRNQLAEIQTNLRLFREARESLTATLASLRQHLTQHTDAALGLELAKTHEGFANLANAAGLTVETVSQLGDAIEVLKKRGLENPGRPEYAQLLGELLKNKAGHLMSLARYQEAETTYQEALQVARQLVAAFPNTPKPLHLLALTCNSYALLVRESGHFPRAAELIRESIRILTRLKTEYPNAPEYWYMLPTAYRNLAQPLEYMRNANEVAMAQREAVREEAELARVPEASKKWLTDFQKLMASVQNQDSTRFVGQQAEGQQFLQDTLAAERAHAGIPAYRMQLIGAKNIVAIQLIANGSREAGLQELRECQERAEKLAADFPDIPTCRELAATACHQNGLGHLFCGKVNEGQRLIEQGVALREKLAGEYPELPEIRYRSSEALVRAAGPLGYRQEARQFMTMAVAVLKKLAESYPRCPKFRREVAQGTMTLGSQLLGDQDNAATESAYRESIRLWRGVVKDFPEQQQFQQALGDALRTLGTFLAHGDRFKEAEAAYLEIIGLYEQLVRAFPNEAEYSFSLGGAYSWYGQLQERQGQYAASAESHGRALASIEAAVKCNPRHRDWLGILRQGYLQRSGIYLKLGRRKEYDNDLQSAKILAERLDPPLVHFYRIKQLLAAGKQTDALQDAEDLFENTDLPGSDCYELAGIYAQAAAAVGEPRDKEPLAVKAIALLGRAYDQGYRNPVPADGDVPFRGLVERADFKKMIAAQR